MDFYMVTNNLQILIRNLFLCVITYFSNCCVWRVIWKTGAAKKWNKESGTTDNFSKRGRLFGKGYVNEMF